MLGFCLLKPEEVWSAQIWILQKYAKAFAKKKEKKDWENRKFDVEIITFQIFSIIVILVCN